MKDKVRFICKECGYIISISNKKNKYSDYYSKYFKCKDCGNIIENDGIKDTDKCKCGGEFEENKYLRCLNCNSLDFLKYE